MALSINNTKYNSIQCHYAKCRVFFVTLIVIMLSAVMLSVTAPRSDSYVSHMHKLKNTNILKCLVFKLTLGHFMLYLYPLNKPNGCQGGVHFGCSTLRFGPKS
jgi:hypothetical protein